MCSLLQQKSTVTPFLTPGDCAKKSGFAKTKKSVFSQMKQPHG